MKQVKEFADKYGMLPRGATVICAVSGGADSVCLLHMMKDLASERELRVYAAHFNHCLRGEESDRDERFVRELCNELGVQLFCASGDVSAYAKEHGVGTEEAARILRYDFFERTAAAIPGSRVATAHNAEDNAETVLMNLSRGAGAKGLCGIPPLRDIYIRPLLVMGRDEIMAYLDKNGLEHVEDSTNAENIYTRNRLRHDVIPVLKSINPGFVSSVLEASELLREDEGFLDELAAKAVPVELDEKGRVSISAALLSKAARPLAARAVRKAAGLLGCYPSAAHVKAVLAISESAAPSAKTQLPGGITAAREYGRLVFMANEAKGELPEKELYWMQWTAFPELGMSIYFGTRDEIIECDELFSFKKDEICGKIFVRPRRTGDRICLDRRQGTKSLKKLFIEKKIPADSRERIPVIADEKNILAVASLGQADRGSRKDTDCIIAVKKL